MLATPPADRVRASAVVLAGGRSSRMGAPKALLDLDGAPLIVHIVSTLAPLVQDIVVVAAPNQDLPPLHASVVRDAVAYQGPVGGLYYGLSAAHEELSFVTSCDAVFLNPAVVAFLLSQADDYDVVVPFWDGRLQPLHAVYRRSVVGELGAQLDRGELRPVHLFDKVRTRRVEETTLRQIDPEGTTFFNMNSPEDYMEALRRWRAARARAGDHQGNG
jgi:molybdopterin-guanine dinucleotide biosynthesis protein A